MRMSFQASLSREGKFSVRIHRAQRQKCSQASGGECDSRDERVARDQAISSLLASLSPDLLPPLHCACG